MSTAYKHFDEQQIRKMKLFNRAIHSLINFWYWLFPKEVHIPNGIQLWLTEMFPYLDLKRVRFHKGLPPILKKSQPGGIVLPSIWGIQKLHVYFKDGPDYYSSRGLGLIAHEMVHVRQYMDYAGGYGLGFARLFLIPYLMSSIKGYRNIPLEIEAYDFGDQIEKACQLYQLSGNFSTEWSESQQNELERWWLHNTHLKMERTSISFGESIWHLLPGLDKTWEFGKSTWTYALQFYQNRRKQISFVHSTHLLQQRTPYTWIRRLLKKLFLALLPAILIGIVNSIAASILWGISLIYFLIANVLMTVFIFIIAITWLILDILGCIAFGFCSIITVLLGLIDGSWWVLKKTASIF